MFYDKVKNLCDKSNISVSKLLHTIDVPDSLQARWKKGAIPKSEILLKIANYFGVTVDYLLDNEPNKDDELNEYLEFLKYRPEGKMLFSVAKNCTKEEVEQAVKIIDAIRSDTGVVG